MWVVVKIMVPLSGTLKNRCRIVIGTQNGTIILTTTHVGFYEGPGSWGFAGFWWLRI